MEIAYKYSPTKPFSIAFAILLGMGFLLAAGRWFSAFVDGFVVINAEVHSHISNLSLSLIVYLGIGYSWFLSGTRFSFIVILGVVMIAANFICETLMAFMNTTDIIDAFYGTIGIVISFVFLIITKKRGLILADLEKSQGYDRQIP